MHYQLMLWFVTGVGAIAVFASLLTIARGKGIGGADSGPQKIKILNHIEITQNSALGLILICTFILLAPAGMLFYENVLTKTRVPKPVVDAEYVLKADLEETHIMRAELRENYKHNDIIKEQYQKRSGREVAILGRVEYENGEPASGATVSVWGADGEPIKGARDMTNASGLYYIRIQALEPLDPGESLTLLASHGEREIQKPDIKPDEIQLDFRLFMAGDK